MTSPGTTPHEPCADAEEALAPNGYCDQCGERNPIDPDMKVITGLWVCVDCVEAMLNAQTYDARAEVGLVGGGH